MSDIITRRFIISGRVQGVYFRASTRDRALQLGLRGYAKNLNDGSVEVVATGAIQDMEILEQWLWQGPATAKVTAVQSVAVVFDNSHARSGFVTL